MIHRLLCSLTAACLSSPLSAQELLYELLPPNGASGTRFGRVIACHGDRFASTSGAVVFICDLESGAVLYSVTSPHGPDDAFGSALALDVEHLLCGAPDTDGKQGAVHVFQAATGAYLGELRGDGQSREFGAALALAGGLALVGAPGASSGTTKCGEVYAMDLQTHAEVARLSLPDNVYGDRFGASVDADGAVAVVGAPLRNQLGDYEGAAYVVDLATWTLAGQLSPPAPATVHFGGSVAVAGGRAVVGSQTYPVGGRADVFDVATLRPVLLLEPPEPTIASLFGEPVDIGVAGVLVGAPQMWGGGAAYLFSRETGDLLAVLQRSDGKSGDFMGLGLALSDRSIALCGAPYENEQDDLSGVLYAFGIPRAWYTSPLNGHVYTLGDEAQSWSEARTSAALLGGDLATIRSAEENAWLADVLPDGNVAHWIGLSDAAQEGNWVWANGDPASYTNWRPGEPDDFFGADWAVFDPTTGLWRDEPEQPARRAIVEVDTTDCDGNGVPDALQILDDPTLDWNGDGQLDVCVPPTTCEALPNSTGEPARIAAQGSPFVADDDLTLVGTRLPADVLGYFLMSAETDEVPFFGGSAGVLCLGGDIARFNKPPQGAVLTSGAYGMMEFHPHLGNLPLGIVVHPGQHWYFQLWFRDYDPLPTSNTTPALDVRFR